jgi:hypothetical protein
MAKNWSYAHAGGMKLGPMVCACCGKKVEGWYRFREKPDKYVVQHRECTQDDPTWAAMDAREAASRERHQALVKACIEFRAKWGITELDEIIGDAEATS